MATVRSADDPLGGFQFDRNDELTQQDVWRRRAPQGISFLQFRRATSFQKYLLTPIDSARLDITINGDPFSVETARVVNSLRDSLKDKVTTEASAWKGASVLLTGTTPSIIDLRTVTL